MNPVLFQLESVNDSITAGTSTVPIRPFESVMRIGLESQTDFIDLLFDTRAQDRW